MRMLWQEARDRIHQALANSDFNDVRAEHLSVLQYPGPDGERPSALAARAGMSRQAINHLVGQLERAGYLVRTSDSADRRARVIALTPRGRKLIDHVEAAVRVLEREWAQDIGEQRAADLRTALVELQRGRISRSRP